MEIQNLNSKQFLKETPAGEIPADWACAPLAGISEIHDSKITPEASPGRIFITRCGKIYNSRPPGTSSVSITVKKGFSLLWIKACLRSERKPFKFTKKCLENHHIPLPPAPEIKNARETLKNLQSLIHKCRNRLAKDNRLLRESFREEEAFIRFEKYLLSFLEKKANRGNTY